jgi:hypothetical protein
MNNSLIIPCDTGEVSDGIHTFNELYDHRCSLFLAFMKNVPGWSWISLLHDDGSSYKGWFIGGICLPTGDITYHLPVSMWELANKTGARVLSLAPKWDGHTSQEVVERIKNYINMENTEKQS